ncbi:MAG: hypothetical protein EOM21_21400 [Gammaproteobacteria bacterium]|nr:hypothetical protein [Gammaproteobacteria bacterium]
MTINTITTTNATLADFLCAEYGAHLAVFADGSHQIIDSGAVPDGDFIAIVRCPGIGNLDGSVFAEGYAERGGDGIYRRITDDTEVGDLEALITESCREGDVTAFCEDLEAQLAASATELATSL